MVWLILGTKRYVGTDRIDMAVDVHLEVWRDSVENHAKYTGAAEKC
jgi:hypothetical protein